MTETEAYQAHGWPVSGRGMILPITGDGADWTPYRCSSCDWRGVAHLLYWLNHMDRTCPGCGGRLTEWNTSVSDPLASDQTADLSATCRATRSGGDFPVGAEAATVKGLNPQTDPSMLHPKNSEGVKGMRWLEALVLPVLAVLAPVRSRGTRPEGLNRARTTPNLSQTNKIDSFNTR